MADCYRQGHAARFAPTAQCFVNSDNLLYHLLVSSPFVLLFSLVLTTVQVIRVSNSLIGLDLVPGPTLVGESDKISVIGSLKKKKCLPFLFLRAEDHCD